MNEISTGRGLKEIGDGIGWAGFWIGCGMLASAYVLGAFALTIAEHVVK